jgi:hypothetical protein
MIIQLNSLLASELDENCAALVYFSAIGLAVSFACFYAFGVWPQPVS